MSSAFPGIKFDNNGVCNFCKNEIIAATDTKVIKNAREKVRELFEKKTGTSGYDAIICYSGGKDSTYTLKLAVDTYGLKVLSFTLDNGFLSHTAFDNIKRITDSLGVDHITYKPSSIFMKSIIRESALKKIYSPVTLKRISSVCNSCISIVNLSALKIALEKNIPFIISGFTLGQIPANSIIYQSNYHFLQESRKAQIDKLREHVGDTVDDYLTIPDDILNNIKSYPHNINLLCLEEINENDIIQNVKEIGWEEPNDVDGCSSNCRLNIFNNYIHEKTMGYNPYELELSHLIRKGHLTRDEALEKINRQPLNELDSIISALGIEKESL
jgi:hypothetical protein